MLLAERGQLPALTVEFAHIVRPAVHQPFMLGHETLKMPGRIGRSSGCRFGSSSGLCRRSSPA